MSDAQGMVLYGPPAAGKDTVTGDTLVIIDPDAKRERMAPRWFPYSPIYRFIPLRSLPRKFAEQELLKAFGIGKLFQALPILRSLRACKLGADSREIEMFWLVHQR